MSGPPPTRRAYDASEVVSALQKAIRRSDPDAALYWGVELARSGYGPWLWSRLRTIVVEDVSPEATGVVADLHALSKMWAAEQKSERSDGMLYVTRALIALAIAPKNRVATFGLIHHQSDHVERRDVPDWALDKHTARGRAMGRGTEHFREHAAVLEPWTGSLEELEAEYREKSERSDSERPGARTPNPWGSPEPAQNSEPGVGFGQLRMTGKSKENR